MKGVMNSSCENLLKQELEKLKADYQNLFDENPLAMFIADYNTSAFIAVNKAAVKTYGYSRKEFLNLTLENLSKHKSAIHRTSQSLSSISHFTKSGEVLYVEARKKEIVYKGIAAELITITDVTELVLSKEKEKSKEEARGYIYRYS